MNNRKLRRAWALLLLPLSLGVAAPALADVGTPSHSNVGAKLGTCVAQVIGLSDHGNTNLDNLEKGIMSRCQPEIVEWNAWCRPLFKKQHSVDYAVARCDREWALTVATIISALKQGGALHFKSGK